MMMPARKNHEEIDEDDCDLAEPFASSMSQSLRAFGYDLPSAIADLVDNSIFAAARNIWIDFKWDGDDSSICITDDGRGMAEKEMLDAMRPGSRNPLEARDPGDLGRYGLGLKTASFSQCRRLTVRSRRGNKQVTRCWDLDFIQKKNKWLLLKGAREESEPNLSRLAEMECGTSVLWEKMDRNVPLLLIDDEADNASVNTNPIPVDDNGVPLDDYDVTAINGGIRKILDAFEKSAYVGYTATPFANIFIFPEGNTDEHGEDLFPRSFIINLPTPSNYIGPARVFGIEAAPEAGIQQKVEGLPTGNRIVMSWPILRRIPARASMTFGHLGSALSG
jgi:hypothetical protein